MRIKDFKKILDQYPEDTLVLMDDSCGTFYPIQTIELMPVMTDQAPDDENLSFIHEQDFLNLIEKKEDVSKFNAIVLSLEEIIERMTDDDYEEDEFDQD